MTKKSVKTEGPARVFVGLGSNVGDRAARIRGAVDWLGEQPEIELRRMTSIAETEPWGLVDQRAYYNAVLEIATALPPLELLRRLKAGETALGRRPRERWGPREIDLDILLYGNEVVETPELSIPHPQIPHRNFVLVHLLELDTTLMHPVLNRPLNELLANHSGTGVTKCVAQGIVFV